MIVRDRSVFVRVSVPPARERIKALRAGDYRLDPAKTRAAWRAAQRELGIPKMVPVKIPQRQVMAAGPNTPD